MMIYFVVAKNKTGTNVSNLLMICNYIFTFQGS